MTDEKWEGLDVLAVADREDATTILDYIAGTTGGANHRMPSQWEAAEAAKRLRGSLVAAVRERDELRAALTEVLDNIDYINGPDARGIHERAAAALHHKDGAS